MGELEADIMNVVWRLGGASVKDVFEELYPTKRLAYTTIMTVMSRLANKGILKQDRSNTAYMYTPKIDQQEMANTMISQVIDKVLGGDVMPALTFLLQRSEMDEAEIEKIKKAINKKKGLLKK
ncbi:MAG: BlaI/MecI/CopY family transcriptional regulator [Actinomycetota bacterium]|nr:BlaI/MecI/CopY family transcriptional regulator [Actinomycetota bacterium]